MIDATPSSPTANSYLAVADADTMAAQYGLNAWASLTTSQKEAGLCRAAQDIDTHRIHDGEPMVIGQALLFPRFKDQGVIPNAVLFAALYQADWLAASGEADKKNWEGAKGSALKDSGNGSPLCPRAFSPLARFISRTGSFSGPWPNQTRNLEYLGFTMDYPPSGGLGDWGNDVGYTD